MNRLQMLQDLKGIAVEREEPSHNCDEANKLLKMGDMREFLNQNISIRDYPEFLHFLSHLMIECYELGYKRKCIELEEKELEKIYEA